MSTLNAGDGLNYKFYKDPPNYGLFKIGPVTPKKFSQIDFLSKLFEHKKYYRCIICMKFKKRIGNCKHCGSSLMGL